MNSGMDRAFDARQHGEFRKMFQAEIVDANSASVVSGPLGIPLSRLSADNKRLLENQTQESTSS
jgi:hypothetical protein